MPTGYTAALYDGKPQSFEEFLFTCARAFGALVIMRDDPLDAPFPDEFKPSDYHAKALQLAEADLADLKSLSSEEIEERWKREDAARQERNQSNTEKCNARAVRYDEMLTAAEEWTPPTPDHSELKAFMIDQLKQSIDFDCKVFLIEGFSTAEDWYADAVKDAERRLSYHTIENQKELDRTRSRNEWIKALRESLT